MTKPFLPLVVAMILAGCASMMPPHQITLLERNGSSHGTGTAPRQMGNAGPMTIQLDGATYEGNWVYVRGGQAGLLQTWGTGSSFSTSTMAVQNASGVGNVLLSGSGGSALRCQFRYSEMTKTGIGACKDDDGTLYDMQIITP